MAIRIGNVSFLNAIPLVEGLDRDPEVEVVGAVPSLVADELRAARLDIGLAPVMEVARQHLFALPDIGVVSRGPVRSVLLVTRVEPAAIRTLALDPASRTSAALVQVLLQRSYGVRPEIVIGPSTGPPLPDDVDAALVIGDRALTEPVSGRRIDLAEWWLEETGLPFVFAVWAGRDPEHLARLGPKLRSARDLGLDHLDAIAARSGPPCGVAVELARSYLKEVLAYDVGPREREGIELFLSLARTAGLLGPDDIIRFTA